MTELPIACTLTPDGMTARLALIDALAADGLLDRTADRRPACACACATRPRSSGARASSSPPNRSAARSWTSTSRREDGELVLDIAGPADARPVIDMFFAPEAA